MSSALFFIVLCSWQNFNAALNLGNLSIAPPPELLWLACFLTSWPQTKDVELMVNHVLIGKESLPTKKTQPKKILGFMPRGTCGMTLPAPVRPSTPANHFLFLKVLWLKIRPGDFSVKQSCVSGAAIRSTTAS